MSPPPPQEVTESSAASTTPLKTPAREIELDATVAFSQETAHESPITENLQQLPSYVTRGLVYLLFSMVMTALLYCAFAKVPVIKTARATVVPKSNLQQIQADCEGILLQLKVAEGERVTKGAILAEIDSREVVQHLSKVRTVLSQLELAERALKQKLPNELNQIESQLKILQSKQKSLVEAEEDLKRQRLDLDQNRQLAKETREVEILQEEELLKQADLNRSSTESRLTLKSSEQKTAAKLRKSGGFSLIDFERVNTELKLAESEFETADSKQISAKQAKDISAKKYDALQLDFDQKAANLKQSLDQNRILQESVAEEIKKTGHDRVSLTFDYNYEVDKSRYEFEQTVDTFKLSYPGINDARLNVLIRGKQQIAVQTLIKSPMSGIIGKLVVRNPNEAVTRGQTVMTLIPTEGEFRAEIRVANRDVGLLKPRKGRKEDAAADKRLGSEVRLKFDAFPHVEHGYIPGELLEIVPDTESSDPERENYYRGYVSLERDFFSVRGDEIPLMAGMTASAEIITEYQTILQLLLKPILELKTPYKAKTSAPPNAQQRVPVKPLKEDN